MSESTTNVLFLFYLLTLLIIGCVWSEQTANLVKCKAGQCENNGVCVNETCLCTEGWTGSLCQFCDGRFRLTGDKGELHDGAGNYSLNTKCTWIIDANSSLPIKLTFHHFSTECGWDHLHVFDGSSVYSPLVGSFSGISKNVKDVVLHSGYGFLYFFSDISYSMGGFNLTYKLLHCPNDCSGHGVCNTSICECKLGWTGDDCSTGTGCANGCSNSGTCVNGTCQCHQNSTGEDCSLAVDSISWFTIATDAPPVGRASMGADILDDSLYVYGGETLLNRYTIHSNLPVEFYKYNLSSQTWHSLQTNWSSMDRFGHSLSSNPVDGKLYLYGGTVGGLPTAYLACYDTVSDSWQSLADGLLAVTGHTAHVIDNKLYVFFGQSAEYSFHHPLQVYDINNASWSMLSTSGVHVRGRYGHSSVYHADSNSVFVFGGYHDNTKPGSYLITNHAHKFLVENLTWVGLTPAPSIAYLHSATILSEGYMLISGGNSHNDTAESSGSQCYSSALLAYDLCCDRWLEVSVIDNTEHGIDRYGHTMFIHQGFVYIYGGFNGIMLQDVARLYTPNCSLFTTEMDCKLGASLQSHSGNHTVCEWTPASGCVAQSWTGSCDVTSCRRSEEENKFKCNQFVDCESCLSTDGCYYRAASSADFCGVIPPADNVNPALQKVETCGDRDCEIERNCNLCNAMSQCVWSSTHNGCMQRHRIFNKNNMADTMCSAPCHTHHSCSNCTSNSCLWCESQSTCIDSNSYLTYFPYGQCLEWTTMENKCVAVLCEDIGSCSECQRNAMCGWCNDPSNTGKGRCMKGGLNGDLNSTCTNPDWFFTTCPECQCNGHSTCDYRDKCMHCSDNTTGTQCSTCAPGFFGDPTNGGSCQRCTCDDVADACDATTGACLCRVQGATGDRCDKCDVTRQYLPDSIYNSECYYRLSVDYKYTFNFSKPEDKHVTRINLQTSPNYADRNVEFTIECRGYADTNLSLYSVSYPGRYHHFVTISCPRQSSGLTLSHKDYEFGFAYNSTLLLTINNFTTPFVFQVSFTQHSRINLMLFLLIFFGCFLALLMMAALVWKIRTRYQIMQRRIQQRQERRIMASRPFSSVFLSVDDLKGVLSSDITCTQQSASQQPTSTAEPPPSLHRTFSKRNKRKHGLAQHNSQVTAVGFEPLDYRPAAVVSVLVKLPTGGKEVSGYGCSGLAFGSALVTAGSNANSYASAKVHYKSGKVTFKAPSIFQSS